MAACDPTPRIDRFYVYMLKNRQTNQWYYGYTNNLQRRLVDHEHRASQKLIYHEAYRAEADARRRERQLKRYAQALTALKARVVNSLQ